MPVLMALDFETTGLDVTKDQVIEVGSILYSTGLQATLESSGYLVKTTVSISEEITKITGIHSAAVEKFGYESEDALDALLNMMSKADAVIGQNVIRFDKRVLQNWAARIGRTVPDMLWIDTRTDIPGVEGKHLSYMACDMGFINLFPHSALADCQTVIKLIEGRDIDAIMERAKSPLKILQAHVSYDTNKLAKARGYKAYYQDGKFQFWWKIVKQMDLPVETGHGEFEVGFIENVAPEVLMYQ